MSHLQLTDGRDVSLGILREDDNAVSDVVFDRINVSVLRVNVNASVELDIGLGPPDHSLGFGPVGAGRCVVQPVEYPDAPCVRILHENFIAPGIDRYVAVNWIQIPDVTHGGTSHFDRPASIL